MSNHGCDRCTREDRDVLEAVGEPERRSFGKAHETEQRYRCRLCGAAWMLLEEGGMSGQGAIVEACHVPLTAPVRTATAHRQVSRLPIARREPIIRGVQAALVESPEVLAFQQRLSAISSESRIAPAEYERARVVSRQIETARQEAARARLVATLKAEFLPVVERFVRSGERYAQVVAAALDVEPSLRFGRLFWQLALAGLRQQGKNAEAMTGIVRKLPAQFPQSRIIASVWPRELARRYDALVDEIDDISENIALGLSPEFKAQISEAMSELPPSFRE